MGSNPITLYPWQQEAIKHLKKGSILCGSVGSGKTLTSLSYYKLNFSSHPIFVITTAKKRDTKDWERDANKLGISEIVVDSWNNIKKYQQQTNAFFIFDEQHVVGYGAWSKAFIKIAKANQWILLSATPGDTWMDYIPVFIANGFYRNKTDFIDQHVEFDRFAKFPKVKKYHNQEKLRWHRKQILIKMDFKRDTERVRLRVDCSYDVELYSKVRTSRWNPYTERPARTPSELTGVFRRLVSDTADRKKRAKRIMRDRPRIVVFYNYNYERDILLKICNELAKPYAEWTGHKHEMIPDTKNWIYIVNYAAGSDAWETKESDSMLFYSPNYSYKVTEQCEGRIDRLGTQYKKLKYYYMHSDSAIDKAVYSSIRKKKQFNVSAWQKEEWNYARK